MISLTVTAEAWPLARPFAISRGVKTEALVVVAEVSDGEFTGRGECVPYPRYGETVEAVVALLIGQAAAVAAGLDRAALQSALPAGAARNGLDCALWDFDAKRAGRRAWELAGIAAPTPTVTAETIGLGPAREMAARAAELAAAPLLKVKLDGHDVIDRMQAVHQAAPAARLIVDPNEGWDAALLGHVAPDLAALGVEMLEQPLPADNDAALAEITCPIPICADESCHTAADLPGLAGKYQIINIKLDKTGGLTGALALADAAQAAGFGLMVGCMVGTSLAMAPATLLTPRAQFTDLDGPLLLKADREPGLDFSGGRICPPGVGVWG